jgi:hypothetical protein
LVLAGPTTLFRGAFPDSDAKDAFIHGCFEVAPNLSTAVLDVLQPATPLLVEATGPPISVAAYGA